MVLWVFIRQTHQIIHFKYVKIIVRQLYLNKGNVKGLKRMKMYVLKKTL